MQTQLGHLKRIQKKGSNDLVSYVDKTAEEMLKATCKELLPGSGFIAEEGEDEFVGDGVRNLLLGELANNESIKEFDFQICQSSAVPCVEAFQNMVS